MIGWGVVRNTPSRWDEWNDDLLTTPPILEGLE